MPLVCPLHRITALWAHFSSVRENTLPKHCMKSLWEQPSSPCLPLQTLPGVNVGG